jgi:hypothetical protein
MPRGLVLALILIGHADKSCIVLVDGACAPIGAHACVACTKALVREAGAACIFGHFGSWLGSTFCVCRSFSFRWYFGCFHCRSFNRWGLNFRSFYIFNFFSHSV